MSKFYTVDKKINGEVYTGQFNGISAALKAIDDSYIEGSSNTSLKKLATYLFNHVVITPKIKIDDFGAEKIGTTETKTIGDVEYTAKFNGMTAALEAIDNSYIEGSNNTSSEKLAKYLLEEVIVSPANLTADDFDSMDDFNAVISFAKEVMQGGKAMDDFNAVVGFAKDVMQGNFRDKKQSGAKEESKG